MKNVQELAEIIDSCNNVRGVYYTAGTNSWRIDYDNDLPSDHLETDIFVEFLESEGDYYENDEE